ncbi:prenyltransferase/squalene oxidase repeat-containing protein [Rubripirellula reticaptiva]|uniref:Squalene cyclase C-terminal domain-containing protein n=1 Tax=Rubripirellula reticaptiva TaxID=2528013 RepID=A0A5C6F7D1_9BACT|nr:prenyltransferase/squalene oxidase repeat-containing protein [Rubripirellula reticaptiva]TWU55401.1 hypothetical protein Poly59_16990 [Rubripirellula reticaptiva]
MTESANPWLDSSVIDSLWADPRLVYTVAALAVATLGFTIWLFRRRGRGGRQAGVICLVLSIALHAALIFLVPLLPSLGGGSSTTDPETDEQAGIDSISFTTFDPNLSAEDAAGGETEAMLAPLPVSSLTDLLANPVPPEEPASESVDEPESLSMSDEPVPESLSETTDNDSESSSTAIDSLLGDFLDDAFAASVTETAEPVPMPQSAAAEQTPVVAHVGDGMEAVKAIAASTSTAPPATVPGAIESDFANRVGKAKDEALLRTGGDASTEAAVEAALRFLASAQRADGAWDPSTTGAGIERAPLGMTRGNAGSRSESALTGLSLLALTGAGQTHQQGQYSDNAYRGLAYLIRTQKSSGSLAGGATIYAANYSHGMAALAMCETAALTHDPSAVAAATRAINFTRSMQHPSTGGWRYTAGDPGDLSQLGWQAMVLDAGYRAGVPVDARAVDGVERFLRSVRAGSTGGMACYRAGEMPSRTMTAEALATRLLIGQKVPAAEIEEAERYLLQQQPGVGQDNYYYWYYATLALHQLQDAAWDQWNAALKRRLLSTQLADGSWPTDSVWGGYGGSVYTTAMATLCLEAYYRHSLRSDSERIARMK